jgi:hypothetical protein
MTGSGDPMTNGHSIEFSTVVQSVSLLITVLTLTREVLRSILALRASRKPVECTNTTREE